MPGHTDEQLKHVAKLYAKHDGSSLAAAKELGIPRTTFATRVEVAKIRGFIREEVSKVEESDEVRKVYLKPHYKIYQRPPGQRIDARVLAIGDAHDGVEVPDKSRFYAMGQYALSNQITHIVQIGDFASMDSMSTHDKNDTIKGQNKPSYKEDLDSFSEALQYFDNGLEDWQGHKHVTLGNHEDRIGRFVNSNPEMAELLYEKLYALFDRYEWTYSPFGEFFFIGDVGFTHVPLNQMGKPYGGMHSENSIARDTLHDIVYGHTHKRVDKSFPKIGHDHVTVVNLGCSLPDGHIEEYAKHSVTGWSYGVYDLTIRDGKIKQRTWVPMDVLLETYT